MRTTDDCKLDSGFINYLTFLFCIMGDKTVILGLILLVSIKAFFFLFKYFMLFKAVWLFILFVGLGVTADA